MQTKLVQTTNKKLPRYTLWQHCRRPCVTQKPDSTAIKQKNQLDFGVSSKWDSGPLLIFAAIKVATIADTRTELLLQHRESKNKPLTILLAIASSNADRFSKFFHLRTHYISRQAQPRRDVQWSRPSVCLSLCVCLFLAIFAHYCTDPDVSWRNDRGALQLWNVGRICKRCMSLVAMKTQRRTRNVSKCLCSLYTCLVLCNKLVIKHLKAKFHYASQFGTCSELV